VRTGTKTRAIHLNLAVSGVSGLSVLALACMTGVGLVTAPDVAGTVLAHAATLASLGGSTLVPVVLELLFAESLSVAPGAELVVDKDNFLTGGLLVFLVGVGRSERAVSGTALVATNH